MFKAFIPKRIKNHTVLSFLEMLRSFQKLFHSTLKLCVKHFVENEEIVKKYQQSTEDDSLYIEDQKALSEMKYGKSTMSYAGCEVIATYNVLKYLGHKPYLPAIILEYERDGMIFSGRFGTSPLAISDYFENHGFKVDYTPYVDDFDYMAEVEDALILTYYNNKNDIFAQIHTIAITRDEDGYVAHNVHGDGSILRKAMSISEIMGQINNGNCKGISLLGISI